MAEVNPYYFVSFPKYELLKKKVEDLAKENKVLRSKLGLESRDERKEKSPDIESGEREKERSSSEGLLKGSGAPSVETPIPQVRDLSDLSEKSASFAGAPQKRKKKKLSARCSDENVLCFIRPRYRKTAKSLLAELRRLPRRDIYWTKSGRAFVKGKFKAGSFIQSLLAR